MSELLPAQSVLICDLDYDDNRGWIYNYKATTIDEIFRECILSLQGQDVNNVNSVFCIRTLLCSDSKGILYWTRTRMSLSIMQNQPLRAPIISDNVMIDGYVICINNNLNFWSNPRESSVVNGLVRAERNSVIPEQILDPHILCYNSGGNTTINCDSTAPDINRLMNWNIYNNIGVVYSNQTTNYHYYCEGLPIGTIMDGLIFRPKNADRSDEITTFTKISYRMSPPDSKKEQIYNDNKSSAKVSSFRPSFTTVRHRQL